MSGRIEALAQHAPDVVAAWRGIEEGRLITVRREVRRLAASQRIVVEAAL